MSYVDTAEIEEHLKNNVTLFPTPKPRFRRERFDEIEPTGSEWLVKHFLPAKGVGILAGPSTVGKSFVVLYFCLRIVMGKHVLNHKSCKSGVLYVAAEGQNGMRKRIKALRDKFSIKTFGFQFIGQAPNLLDEADMAELIASSREAGQEMHDEAGVDLGLIVIDTTAASMPGGNENAGEDMSKALANCQKLSEETGALVLLVGHTGKNEALGVRGWSGQIGNSDVIIYLSKDENEPSLRTGVVFKLKDGEDGERFAYRLRSISMGYDADGDAITSAYPSFEEAPLENAGKRKSGSEMPPGCKLIMRVLRIMLDEGQSELVPPVPGVPAGAKAVRRTALRERCVQMGYADAGDRPETVKRAFNREILKLIASMNARSEGELIWPIR